MGEERTQGKALHEVKWFADSTSDQGGQRSGFDPKHGQIHASYSSFPNSMMKSLRSAHRQRLRSLLAVANSAIATLKESREGK